MQDGSKRPYVMNEDEGGYRPSHLWDGLLAKTTGEQGKN